MINSKSDEVPTYMKLHFSTLLFSAVCVLTANAVPSYTLNELGMRLIHNGCYKDSAFYEVLLPNLAEPVAYRLQLESNDAEGDTLAPCRYFIEWQLPTPNGISDGFLAYFDGTHYRQRDERLQEYHFSRTPEVFAPQGRPERGVQQQAQFSDLLPQSIGRRFIEMSNDSSYLYRIHPDTLVGGQRATVVEGVRRLSGFDCAEYVYVLDINTLRPRRLEFENNPGQLGEQAITVIYDFTNNNNSFVIDENYVVGRKPEEFEKYRESTFTIESLPGRGLPRIASRTASGERYMHERGEALAAPTIFVFLDATVGSTPQVIESVRDAIDTIPGRTDIVWAFINQRNEDIEGLISPRTGETILIGARSAARECGVGNVTPVLIFADAAGTVSDFIVGNNQNLTSLVIEKASIASIK